MRGVNKMTIIGNLGAEPQVRYTQTGRPVVNLSIATNESFKDRNTGEQKQRTEWHSVVLFDRKAEVAQQYLHKGSAVYIEGRLQTRKWQDNNGIDRYKTDVIANQMQMLDGSGQGHGAPQPQQQQQQQQNRYDYGNQRGQQPRAQPQQQNQPAMEPPMDFDDDIPF